MLNPLTIKKFCETGQKDALFAYLETEGFTPTNPNMHGYQMNKLFNQLVGQLDFLKSKGLSYFESNRPYFATDQEIDICRFKNKIYYAKQDSNTIDPFSIPKTPDTNPDFWGVLYDLNNPAIDNLTTSDPALPLSANQGLALKGYIDAINTLLASDDTTLDELQEIVTFIKLNKTTLDSLGIASIAGLQTALDSKLTTTSLLTAMLAVDGAGSGLDADKLDGVELSAIAQKTNYATSTTGGTVKARLNGSTAYFTINGATA